MPARGRQLRGTGKREAGLIFDDLNKPPYKLIFNSGTSAQYLWESVVMMREVEAELKRKQDELSGKEQLVAIHGNRFILHVVSERLKKFGIGQPTAADIQTHTDAVLSATVLRVLETFSSAYPANLFKNASKCRELELHVVGSTSHILPGPVPAASAE